MFIKNKRGEIVNTDYILAMKMVDDSTNHRLHVFTEKTETVFECEDTRSVLAAERRISALISAAGAELVNCQNWSFRADKLMAVNDEPCRNLTISMVGRDFHVYTSAQSDNELLEIKRQIAKSMCSPKQPWVSNVTVIV